MNWILDDKHLVMIYIDWCKELKTCMDLCAILNVS